MSDRDVVIGTQLRVPDGSTIATKPSYLITLTEKTSGKSAQFRRFVAIELPTMQTSYIQTKGFFYEAGEEEIIANYATIILTAISNKNVVEMYFPWHSIVSIRSLVFKAK